MQLEELDFPWCALDFHAGPRQLVQRPTVALERREHRRHLFLAAKKTAQHHFDIGGGERGHRGTFDDHALTVTRRGARAEPDREPVALATAHDLAGDLGGLAETDRQHAGRERIEAPHVTCPRGVQHAPNALQGRVGRHPDGLVEQKNSSGQS